MPALTLVLLPKCPLCLAAYFGILGSLGVDTWVRASWGLPLGALLLASTLCALALRALRARDFRPPLLGIAGAATLLGAKFLFDAPLLVFAGAVTLVLASIWSVRLARRASGRSALAKA